MDGFDFMFPEQAEASHLRAISNQLRIAKWSRDRQNRARRRDSAKATADIDELRDDVQFLSMVVLALVKRGTETGTLSVADLADLFDEIDGLDGTADGGLDVGVLRGALGAVRAAEAPEVEPETPRIEAPKRRFRRYRRR